MRVEKISLEGAVFCTLCSQPLPPTARTAFFCLPKNVINGNPTVTLNHRTDLKCGSHVSEQWSRKIKTPAYSITLLLHIPGLSPLDSFNMREHNTSIILKPLLFWVFSCKWQNVNLINIIYMYYSKARWINKLIGMKYLNWFASSEIWIMHLGQIKGRITLSKFF